MAGMRINYDKVISQADSMQDLADSLKSRIDDLTNMQNSLRTAWVGPAATAFQKKLSELISDMQSTRSDMDSVINRIVTTAKAIKKEDERLAAMAQEQLV